MYGLWRMLLHLENVESQVKLEWDPIIFKIFFPGPLTKSQNLLYFPSMIEKSILGR